MLQCPLPPWTKLESEKRKKNKYNHKVEFYASEAFLYSGQ